MSLIYTRNRTFADPRQAITCAALTLALAFGVAGAADFSYGQRPRYWPAIIWSSLSATLL
jgi:hypothetical protein